MRTVGAPVEGEDIRVEPAEEPGIRINGVPADLEHVQKADVRVDLAGEAGRSFVVEHALGPLGLCGVTAAEVTGRRETWAFERPEHRFCYSIGAPPSRVVGHPAGRPNPAIAAAILDAGVVEREPPARRSVSEPVRYEAETGAVALRPRERGAGVRLDVRFRGEERTAEVDPAGGTDPELIDRVTAATTPYLTEDPGEGITHSIADLVADIAVLGGFEDLHVEADLGGGYHALTVGAVRRAHEADVVVSR